MKFRTALKAPILAAITIAIALTSAALAAEPSRAPAPNFSGEAWLNSKPLRLPDLRGKVVLVDFWEYTCINCIRTFPYLRRWNSIYGPLGLVVIGVHTPEFAFAKDHGRVEEAAKRFRLTFPIAIDSDYKIWDAFHNEAWPAKYLIDKDGNVAFVHLGEGDYAEFERHIQALLAEANPQLKFSDPKFTPLADNAMPPASCGATTPETYLGFARGERLANSGGYQANKDAAYNAPESIPVDGYALSGRWLATPEAAAHRGGGSGDALTLHYQAKSVYLVAGADGMFPGPLYISQDGKPVQQDARGVEVKVDAQGRTMVTLSGKRMYYLIKNPDSGEHTLKLTAAAAPFSLYSFTFGDNCENAFDHR
jgi:thiol-disulfide isomerase/thioredoxin